MTKYILMNQHDEILCTNGEWKSTCAPADVYRSDHKDIALNHLIELNSADINLRAQVVSCDTNEKNLPVLPDRSPAASTKSNQKVA